MKNNIKIQKIEAITIRKNYIAGRMRDLVQMRSTKYGAISVMTGCPIFQPRTWNFSNIFYNSFNKFIAKFWTFMTDILNYQTQILRTITSIFQ